eukprot:gene11681-biopygen7875
MQCRRRCQEREHANPPCSAMFCYVLFCSVGTKKSNPAPRAPGERWGTQRPRRRGNCKNRRRGRQEFKIRRRRRRGFFELLTIKIRGNRCKSGCSGGKGRDPGPGVSDRTWPVLVHYFWPACQRTWPARRRTWPARTCRPAAVLRRKLGQFLTWPACGAGRLGRFLAKRTWRQAGQVIRTSPPVFFAALLAKGVTSHTAAP